MQRRHQHCIAVGVFIIVFLFVNVIYFQRNSTPDYSGLLKQQPVTKRVPLNISVKKNSNSSSSNTNSSHDLNHNKNTTSKASKTQAPPTARELTPNLSKASKTQAPPTARELTPPLSLPSTLDNIKINPDNYNYILNPSNTCSSLPEVEIVICVPISRNNFEGRRAVSDTWGSYAYQSRNKAVLLFFIGNGSASESPEIEARIQDEAKRYNDVVQEDYLDSYRNLTLKSISILKWVYTYCSKAKFVLKADDDVYVNIPKLNKLLREKATKSPGKKFITGHAIYGARPNRDPASKWHTSISQFHGVHFPPYTSGTAYAMTGETAKSLYLASQKTPFFWLEDVYITGMCRKKAGVFVEGNKFMTYEKPSPSGCEFRKRISGHRYSLQQMRRIHKELYDKDLKCSMDVVHPKPVFWNSTGHGKEVYMVNFL